jgi:hypothetical protein
MRQPKISANLRPARHVIDLSSKDNKADGYPLLGLGIRFLDLDRANANRTSVIIFSELDERCDHLSVYLRSRAKDIRIAAQSVSD